MESHAFDFHRRYRDKWMLRGRSRKTCMERRWNSSPRAQQQLLRKQELLQKLQHMFDSGNQLRLREEQTTQARRQTEANFKRELDLLNRELR